MGDDSYFSLLAYLNPLLITIWQQKLEMLKNQLYMHTTLAPYTPFPPPPYFSLS